MRRSLVAILLLAGCNAAGDRLKGSWEFDKATYELIPKYQALTPGEQRFWVDTATMDLTFTGDTMTWDQNLPGWGRRSARGKYKVVDSDGNRVTLEAELDDRSGKERFVFTVQGHDVLRFGLGGRSIILRRKKDAAGRS